MIVERRQIFFSADAVLEAVRLFADLPQQHDVPFGTVAAVSVCGASRSPALNILVQQSGASQLRSAKLEGMKVLAALLLLCRRRRVPIPRQADKVLGIEGNGLTLTIACSGA